MFHLTGTQTFNWSKNILSITTVSNTTTTTNKTSGRQFVVDGGVGIGLELKCWW